MIRASGRFSRVVWLSAALGGAFVACSSEKEGGIVLEETGGTGTGGRVTGSGGSAQSTGGNPTSPTAGAGGSAGDALGGQAGSDAGGAGGGAGMAGEGGTVANAGAGPGSTELCIFHTPAPDPSTLPEPEPEPEPTGGAGGAAGDAGAGGAAPEYDVSLKVSPFVGPYLADRQGKALYIYGADFPGDCETPPQSNCVDDCLMAWPLFDAGPRDLQEGLDDAVFGRIEREDGAFQTTYYGWPLYYYRSDTEELPLNGQGRGRIWFAAETVLPNVMIMRMPESAGGMRYLADDRGRSLYVFAEDDVGSASNAPVSHCSAECLAEFAVFTRPAVLPVSSLEPSDFTVFFREDGRAQIAYRGQPLYTSAADTKSGEMNGTATEGWSLITL